MASATNDPDRSGHDGSIHVSDEVVAALAGQAASGVTGLAGLSGGFVSGITRMMGKQQPSRGVRVERDEDRVTLDLYIVVEYGSRIPRIAHQVQERVKKAVEEQTQLRVSTVNVHVHGIAEGDPDATRITWEGSG